jgi:hypothetical protein
MIISILIQHPTVICVTWSVVDPLHWTLHSQGSAAVNGGGRESETYATCSSKNSTTGTIFDSSAMVGANVESYRGRKVPSQFNETSRIALSMFIMLEATIVGFPVLFLAQDQPSANFTVRSVLITLVCLAILGPMFMPRWLYRETGETQRQTFFLTALPSCPDSHSLGFTD